MSSRFHSWSQHNGHIVRNRACPYCTMGSVVVPDVLIDGEWSDGAIVEWIKANTFIEEVL